jgi:predicted nucleotidyltransferase
VLRPILACQWIEKNETMPPVEFEKLLNTQITAPDLHAAISALLIEKKSGAELRAQPKIKVINDFLEEQIHYYREHVATFKSGEKISNQILNRLFRGTLQEVWDLRLLLREG